MPLWAPFVYKLTMTIAPTTSVLAEFTGGAQPDIAMMIGVGLVKESDAVFFQYMGDDQKPVALTIPSNGKPLTYLRGVKLADISIADDIGEFKSTKLNLILESGAGNRVMLTSGLTTLWSQAVICALMGLFNSYDLDTVFTLNSWKGTSKMRPTFASVKIGDAKVSDQMMYDQLRELRADRATDKLVAVMRDSVAILQHALRGEPVDVVVNEADVADVVETADF